MRLTNHHRLLSDPLKNYISLFKYIKHMTKKLFSILILVILTIQLSAKETIKSSTMDITREELLDKIYGGWVGMLIGGLEGLPHEWKYINEPRPTLPDFTYLSKGARTDDDNDFELTHLYFMDKENTLKIPYPRIAEIWIANMKKGIWVANARAYELMNSGMIPPATGSFENNKFAVFNLSAQFCTESYGMVSPGMPQTAAEIGDYYAHISVCCEPIQATQFWTSLISLNIVDKNLSIEVVINNALKSVDPSSVMIELVNDAIKAYHDNPTDWITARQTIYKKWGIEKKWNSNSTPLNGGMVILSLLYGNRDFYKTLQYAMALGLDADCNAATTAAVLGSNIGYKKIASLKGFNMPDIYINYTRPQLPPKMKISEQAELLMRVCEQVIIKNGGEKIKIAGKPGYRIKIQDPRVFEYLNK